MNDFVFELFFLYYFEKKVEIFFEKNLFHSNVKTKTKNDCECECENKTY